MKKTEDLDPYRTRTDVSAQKLRVVDKLAAAFEQGWQKGEQPRIESYLTESPQGVREDLFESLLRIELAVRSKQGKVPPVSEYLSRFQEFAAIVSLLYDVSLRPNRSSTDVQPETWYYLRNNIRVGPFTFEQLKQIVRAGDLKPKDQVAPGSAADWGEAGSIPDLFPRPGESGGLKAPAPGDWIRGDYVLLERVGRGGMGDVFKAYRFSLRQEVALKIVRHDRFVRLSLHKQNEVLQAFRTEMQATANLHHDNIITIFDNGDHNGLPFYTMNFVEKSLASILHHGPLQGQKAAEYIQKVALAVDYANDKGIVHRDIKPGNILLDKQKTLLSDLGLATTEDLLESPANGHVAGTPPFMAPEQMRGDKADKRTDVYGLGATLYCLITGKPPHQGADWAQIRDQVLSAEPLAPRKLNPAVERNLEAITLKCLEKDPEKRYATAAKLAEDLERYLNDRPVLAKIPYFWERLFRWARREPIKAGLVAGILFLLFAFVGCESWSNRRLSANLETVKAEQAAAERAQGIAQQERDRAEKLAKAAEEERAKAIELRGIAQKEGDRADLLAKEAGRQKEQAEQERQKARDTATLLGRHVLKKYEKRYVPQTMDDLVKQAQFSEELIKKDPRDEIKLDLAETYQELANHELKNNRRNEAVAYLLKCISLQKELAEKTPILKVELGLNYLDLGALYGHGQLGNPIQELESDTQALEILEDARKQGYHETAVLAAIAQAHLSLGLDYHKKGEPKESLEHHQRAVLILEQLNSGKKDNITLLGYQTELGRAYLEFGISLGALKPQEAPAYLEKAKKIFEGKSQYRRSLASAYLGLGNAYLDLKEKDKALQPLEEAHALAQQILKDLPGKGSQYDSARGLQAQCLSSQGKAYHLKPDPDPKKAEQLFQQSLEIRKELAAKPGYEGSLVAGLADCAKFHEKEKNVREAIDYYDQAILLQEKYVQQAPKDYERRRIAGVHLYNKAFFLSKNGEDTEALKSLLRAEEHETKAYDLGGGDAYKEYLYLTHRELFVVQIRLKEYEKAIETIQKRLKNWPKDAQKHMEAAAHLAVVHQGDPSEKNTKRIYAFFQQALEQKLLDPQVLRDDSRFRGLVADPAFEKLFGK